MRVFILISEALPVVFFEDSTLNLCVIMETVR